jgi:ABC-2 type transport system ATP-binding protein
MEKLLSGKQSMNRAPTRPATSEYAVEVSDLYKSYRKGQIQALKDVALQIPHGERMGIVGPDGAGKTTLFRILCTLIQADRGHAKVLGYSVDTDIQPIRKRIGYMPGRFSLYPDLSVEENLSFFATLFGTSIREHYELIREIYEPLEPFRHRAAGKLSGGMKQKLALCCALIHKPEILFLDEPTTGVDAVSRKDFWIILRRLKDQGITVVVSTPYMDDASLCERILFLYRGQVLTIDTPQAIIDRHTQPIYAVRSAEMSRLLRDLRSTQQVDSCYTFGDTHHVSSTSISIDTLHTRLEAMGHQQVQIQRIQPTIEDCFIHQMRAHDQ